MRKDIRNIGIIAHVDHGKTTLVDKLLLDAGTFRANEEVTDRAMDSMDLEREKGITIRAKNAMVEWEGVTVNIVDTPGHADFGGEVERILKMVDGVLLLVDAVDGPQAQTRFVLRKALENKLKLVVVVNKVDREFADPEKVHDQVLELLMELDATEEQFNAPFLYASARDGFALRDPADPRIDMTPLFETVLEHIPPPTVDRDGQLEMLVSNLDWNEYVGRIAIGKIAAGRVAVGDSIVCLHRDGAAERVKVSKLYSAHGLGTAETQSAEAGDIVGIAGFTNVFIGETVCEDENREPIPFVEIDPPTIRMQFCVNDGPFAGLDGKFLTARHLLDRLVRETRTNISLEVEETERGNVFDVSARGELQIAVVVETMRREGFELMVSRPQVIYREVDGKRTEPYEDLWIDVPNEYVGDVMKAIADRKGQMSNMEHVGDRVLVEATMSTRGLIGMESWLTNLSGGEGLISHLYKEYGPTCGVIPSRSNGAVISGNRGISTAYALETAQQRGKMFIGPGEEVYEGMIVGECARNDDLVVNPTKTKQLTNVRASGTDKAIVLEPPQDISLEKAIEWIAPDEYVEVTPSAMRLRKKILDPNLRKREEKRVRSSG